MTYSIDFRKKVLSVKTKQRLSYEETAQLFEIGKTTIVNWEKDITAKTHRNKPATKIDMEKLAEDVKKYPDAYIYERAQRLGASKNGVWYALKRLKVTYKKNSESSEVKRRGSWYIQTEDNKISKSK